MTAEDADSDVASSYSGTATVSLASSPAGTLLGGTLTATFQSGVATFAGLRLETAGSGYTLQVASGSLPAVTTSGITVTPGPATMLAVTVQPPSSLLINSPFGLVVAAEDNFGNVTTADGDSITVALANNPGMVALGGRATARTMAGVATFSGLTVNTAGIGYTLEVRGNGLPPAATSAFNVTVPATNYLVTSANDSGTGSLRAAITASNANPSLGNTIMFQVGTGSGLVTIALQSPLPAITVPVDLNGESQSATAGAPPIVLLDGSSIPAGDAADGLTILAGNSIVQGLVIDGFGERGDRTGRAGEQRHPGQLHRRRHDRG